jgi:hypothetical protein
VAKRQVSATFCAIPVITFSQKSFARHIIYNHNDQAEAAQQISEATPKSNVSAKTDARFRSPGEKSSRIRACKAPRGANSKNLRLNSRRLGRLSSQKNCAEDLLRSSSAVHQKVLLTPSLRVYTLFISWRQ